MSKDPLHSTMTSFQLVLSAMTLFSVRSHCEGLKRTKIWGRHYSGKCSTNTLANADKTDRTGGWGKETMYPWEGREGMCYFPVALPKLNSGTPQIWSRIMIQVMWSFISEGEVGTVIRGTRFIWTLFLLVLLTDISTWVLLQLWRDWSTR